MLEELRVVGVRVECEHIQDGAKRHCNSSYFTMVAKDKNGNRKRHEVERLGLDLHEYGMDAYEDFEVNHN